MCFAARNGPSSGTEKHSESEERNMLESSQISIDMSLRLPFIILILQLRGLQRSVLSVDTVKMLGKLISLVSEAS